MSTKTESQLRDQMVADFAAAGPVTSKPEIETEIERLREARKVLNCMDELEHKFYQRYSAKIVNLRHRLEAFDTKTVEKIPEVPAKSTETPAKTEKKTPEKKVVIPKLDEKTLEQNRFRLYKEATGKQPCVAGRPTNAFKDWVKTHQ